MRAFVCDTLWKSHKTLDARCLCAQFQVLSLAHLAPECTQNCNRCGKRSVPATASASTAPKAKCDQIQAFSDFPLYGRLSRDLWRFLLCLCFRIFALFFFSRFVDVLWIFPFSLLFFLLGHFHLVMRRVIKWLPCNATLAAEFSAFFARMLRYCNKKLPMVILHFAGFKVDRNRKWKSYFGKWNAFGDNFEGTPRLLTRSVKTR